MMDDRHEPERHRETAGPDVPDNPHEPDIAPRDDTRYDLEVEAALGPLELRRDPAFRYDLEATNRWTKEGATPGEDPRDIDREQVDPAYVRRLQEHRAVVHAADETSPTDEMGTSATSYDPLERD